MFVHLLAGGTVFDRSFQSPHPTMAGGAGKNLRLGFRVAMGLLNRNGEGKSSYVGKPFDR